MDTSAEGGVMGKKFQRRIEDFVCQHCGKSVQGDGYTNHCPACLHSLHVDINPGDRAAECGGLMVPVALDGRGGVYVVTQRCKKCGFTRRNKIGVADDTEAVLALARQLAGEAARGR